MVPIALDEKKLPSPLALTADRFVVLFNYVPLTVTDCTNHFSLLEESAYGSIERVSFRMPFNNKYQPLYHVASYTSLLQGWNTDPVP